MHMRKNGQFLYDRDLIDSKRYIYRCRGLTDVLVNG